MHIFQVRQNSTGAILWTGSAQDEEAALQAMAHDAGHVGAETIPETISDGGLTVERIEPKDA
ncbi:hypothetical protein ASG40_19430 [Methylobacterium sp. Leaf399]|uniref:hypothetical protein n=1 Tax=Methylobacterium sp. Leaf399 TaxID=1736364 RepID=UPI0006F80187|nr:hypothetical protein [Methylobacterium sp. Leaf399]KQT14000.1 hypothetical protein ASG40_19430 [Methylobacterium sp. Leaf399]